MIVVLSTLITIRYDIKIIIEKLGDDFRVNTLYPSSMQASGVTKNFGEPHIHKDFSKVNQVEERNHRHHLVWF